MIIFESELNKKNISPYFSGSITSHSFNTVLSQFFFMLFFLRLLVTGLYNQTPFPFFIYLIFFFVLTFITELPIIVQHLTKLYSGLIYLWHQYKNLVSSLFPLHSACIEPVAGVVQGRPRANVGVSPLNSASGQVPRAIQWQPTSSVGRGRRLQTRWQITRTVTLQGAGAGQQHNTVSTFWP